MKSPTRVAIIGAVATVLGAAIGTAGTIYIEDKKLAQERTEKERAYAQLDRYRQQYRAAPQIYVKDLESLINSAPIEMKTAAERPGVDVDAVIVTARAIVSTRADMVSSLDAIGSRLDSQIDELRDELKKPDPDPGKLLQTLRVLRAKWPSKRDEIDIMIRKLMAELGLVPEPRESDSRDLSGPSAENTQALDSVKKTTPIKDVPKSQYIGDGKKTPISLDQINCDCQNTQAPNIGGEAVSQCVKSERNVKEAFKTMVPSFTTQANKILSADVPLCDSVAAGPAAWPIIGAPAKPPSVR